MSEKEKLLVELAEAETALSYSERALRTHGHQAITWQYLVADARRVTALRNQLKIAG